MVTKIPAYLLFLAASTRHRKQSKARGSTAVPAGVKGEGPGEGIAQRLVKHGSLRGQDLSASQSQKPTLPSELDSTHLTGLCPRQSGPGVRQNDRRRPDRRLSKVTASDQSTANEDTVVTVSTQDPAVIFLSLQLSRLEPVCVLTD